MRSFEVDGVSCGRCIAHITRAVQDLDADAVVHFSADRKRVDIDSRSDTDALEDAIRDSGYDVRLVSAS